MDSITVESWSMYLIIQKAAASRYFELMRIDSPASMYMQRCYVQILFIIIVLFFLTVEKNIKKETKYKKEENPKISWYKGEIEQIESLMVD